MIIMSVDHASKVFNAGRLNSDSASRWIPGSLLPADQFLTRWITHLCAPTFVLLAGVALALSSERRLRQGHSAADVGAHLRRRGAVLLALEVLWMAPAVVGPGRVLIQVLFALGCALIAMSWLRRLSDRALLALALGILVLGEAGADLLVALGLDRTLLAGLLVFSGKFSDDRLVIAYPLLPWLAVMMLGWVFGRTLLAWRDRGVDASRAAARVLTVAGAAGLALFAVLRGLDGYGNMGLLRDDGSLLQWLHVSKYPPSLTFMSLELGLTALLLAALFRYTATRPYIAGPVHTLGQTALFYYLLHIHVMVLVALAFGWNRAFGVGSAYVGAAAILIALYPACRWYRDYKTAHPRGWTQYV